MLPSKTLVNAKSRFSIEQNNILVRAKVKNAPPDQILLLLPGCLQHPHCFNRITSSIAHCSQCGKCMMSEMVRIQQQYIIEVRVVSGGTAARSIIQQTRPALIIAVACERELIAGINDVRGLPVIGITNETPNGPCNQTTVNIDVLKEYLNTFIRDHGAGTQGKA